MLIACAHMEFDC